MINFITLTDFSNICLNTSPAAPITFFAGAGVSCARPSLLPMPWQVITDTAEVLAPDSFIPSPKNQLDRQKIERDVIGYILPEVYYEIIGEVSGDPIEVSRVWETLLFFKNRSELKPFNLGFNAAHALIVFLSWKGRTPVVTTNFDTMFEDAAHALGLKPVIGHDGIGFQEAAAADEVAIWKVHGTVEAPDTILTTFRALTRVDWPKINRLRDAFQRGAVCLVGYSGRDIDLFPHIAGFDLPKPIFWIDPDFSPKPDGSRHMIEVGAENFLAVQATASDWAQITIPILTTKTTGEQHKIDHLRQVLTDTLSTASTVDWPTAEATYRSLVRDHVESIFKRLFPPGDSRRLLVQALALYRVGDLRASEINVNQFLQISDNTIPPPLTCRALLLKSDLVYSFGHYKESYHYAMISHRLAKSHGLPAVAAQSLLVADESLRTAYLPRLEFSDKWHLLHPSTWRIIMRLIGHLIRYKNAPWQLLAHSSAEPTSLAASFEYIEHRVRCGGILQGLAMGPLRGPMVSIMTRWWNAIEEESFRIGYAAGINHARRYSERLGIPPFKPMEISPGVLSELLKAQFGLVIDKRDYARGRWEKSQITTDIADRILKAQEVKQSLKEAYEIAAKNDLYMEMLKILILQRKIDATAQVDHTKLEFLLFQIQSPACSRIARFLRPWLTKN